MRILHVVPSYLPAWRYGGPIRSVHGLARAQVEAGHRVEVFTTDADGRGRLDVPRDQPVDREGVAVRYFRRTAPKRLFRAPALERELDTRVSSFDLLHLHSALLWPTWRAARAAERKRVPYVVSPRGILDPDLVRLRGQVRKRLWIALVERRTLARAAAIHATSDAEVTALRALGLDIAPVIDVIPNGVARAGGIEEGTEAGAAEADAARSRGAYWLFLGRVAAKKRIEILIEATARVPALRLLVAGNDDEGLSASLDSLARALGVAERVELLGEVRGAAARRLLAGAVALALPSRSENFGNVVLESLLEGRPAIVSPGVGAGELLRTSGSGLVVEATAEAFAEAVRHLHDDPEAASTMGETGRRHVENELGWERIAARMDLLYRRVLDAPSASPAGPSGSPPVQPVA